MTRTPEQAVAWAHNQHDINSHAWHNLCLAFTHDCYDVGSKYPSAIAAWNGAAKKHTVSAGSQVPRGVPVFWSGNTYGHVAISAGSGYCWSSDIYTYGGVDLARIDYISSAWNKNLLGWTEDINGVTVWKPVAPSTGLTVSLADVQAAAKADPSRAQGAGTVGAMKDVLRVERCLAREGILDWSLVDGAYGSSTKAAYTTWQHRCGYTGSAANGIPGMTSLTKLCDQYGYKVTA